MEEIPTKTRPRPRKSTNNKCLNNDSELVGALSFQNIRVIPSTVTQHKLKASNSSESTMLLLFEWLSVFPFLKCVHDFVALTHYFILSHVKHLGTLNSAWDLDVVARAQNVG